MMCHWSVLSFQEKKIGGTEWYIQKHRGERFVILPVINNCPVTEEKALTVFLLNLGFSPISNTVAHTLP